MADRQRIYKENGTWYVQLYDTVGRVRASSFEWAMLLAHDKVQPKWTDLERAPIITQEKQTCPECGRRTETEESMLPGGGAWYGETCTHCDKEVGNWSV